MKIVFGSVAAVLLGCSIAQAATLSNGSIYFEDFEGIALGENVEETRDGAFPVGTPGLYSATGPSGWSVDNTGVPNAGGAPADPGMKEWEGWTFVDKGFFTAEGQSRQFFYGSAGTVAVADPDEYDDDQNGIGGAGTPYFETTMKTGFIDLSGVQDGETVYISFNSSFRGEGSGDEGDDHQTAVFSANFNFGFGASTEFFRWAPNEINPVTNAVDPGYVPGITSGNPLKNAPDGNPFINNAPLLSFVKNGQTNVQLQWDMETARNDWWWAVDNVAIGTGTVEQAIPEPSSIALIGLAAVGLVAAARRR